MTSLEASLGVVAAESGFSGVIRIDTPDGVAFEGAFGMADRGHGIATTPETRFGIASGTKALTALSVVGLIEDGVLELETTARSVLGEDLPLIADDVIVEHLLSHRSGIGDYLDENVDHDPTDHVLSVPVHELAETEQYLRVLGGHPTAFPADARFAYCNGGYVVLALIAERTSGIPFHDLVFERVCVPAGMHDTEFLRMDELPGDAALGYLHDVGLRTNVLHLPVRGNGDGGVFTTAADVRTFWTALFDGRIVPERWVHEMVRPRSTDPRDASRYGLGFWLHPTGDVVMLDGSDAGVSFWTAHDPASGVTRTVISNTTEGAWPIARALEGPSATVDR
jgi:CubicO group peptidase (beta-lactamase class C family)